LVGAGVLQPVGRARMLPGAVAAILSLPTGTVAVCGRVKRHYEQTKGGVGQRRVEQRGLVPAWTLETTDEAIHNEPSQKSGPTPGFQPGPPDHESGVLASTLRGAQFHEQRPGSRPAVVLRGPRFNGGCFKAQELFPSRRAPSQPALDARHTPQPARPDGE